MVGILKEKVDLIMEKLKLNRKASATVSKSDKRWPKYYPLTNKGQSKAQEQSK